MLQVSASETIRIGPLSGRSPAATRHGIDAVLHEQHPTAGPKRQLRRDAALAAAAGWSAATASGHRAAAVSVGLTAEWSSGWLRLFQRQAAGPRRVRPGGGAGAALAVVN